MHSYHSGLGPSKALTWDKHTPRIGKWLWHKLRTKPLIEIAQMGGLFVQRLLANIKFMNSFKRFDAWVFIPLWLLLENRSKRVLRNIK